MAISPQRVTIYLYSAHRAVILAIAQLSCSGLCLIILSVYLICLLFCIFQREPAWMALYSLIVLSAKCTYFRKLQVVEIPHSAKRSNHLFTNIAVRYRPNRWRSIMNSYQSRPTTRRLSPYVSTWLDKLFPTRYRNCFRSYSLLIVTVT